jgi:hypothetical protein
MADLERAAVLVPGRGYTTDGPLLMYAGLAVRRRGGYVHRIAWDAPESEAHTHSWVAGQVGDALEETAAVTGVPAPLVIGKSIGSQAAPLVAERGLPAVWMTPLLTDGPAVAGMRSGTAPCLLIGGSADPFWDGSVARSVTPHVLEIPGADHGMFVDGGLAASAAVLGGVITAIEHFLDQVIWP